MARRPDVQELRTSLPCTSNVDCSIVQAMVTANDVIIENYLSLDALFNTRHLPFLRRFAQRFPKLTIIIDHGAKPPIAEGTWQPWQQEMAAIAALENIYCKLSGLVTEAAPDHGVLELKPWVEQRMLVVVL